MAWKIPANLLGFLFTQKKMETQIWNPPKQNDG